MAWLTLDGAYYRSLAKLAVIKPPVYSIHKDHQDAVPMSSRKKQQEGKNPYQSDAPSDSYSPKQRDAIELFRKARDSDSETEHKPEREKRIKFEIQDTDAEENKAGFDPYNNSQRPRPRKD